MNILLTNDDGYEAIGIQELQKSLGVNNQVFLIAPKDNCTWVHLMNLQPQQYEST